MHSGVVVVRGIGVQRFHEVRIGQSGRGEGGGGKVGVGFFVAVGGVGALEEDFLCGDGGVAGGAVGEAVFGTAPCEVVSRWVGAGGVWVR